MAISRREVLSFGGAALVGCASDSTSKKDEQHPYQASLDASVDEYDLPGAILAVRDTHGEIWKGASGYSDRPSKTPMQVDDLCRIGSVSKTFTAAAFLQHWELGELLLEDPIASLFPEFPMAESITFEHLLTHTSGIYDVVYHPEVVGNSASVHDPSHLVDLAAAEPFEFEPGDGYGYSNTNFFLLGLALELLSGRTWGQELRARLLDPLGLGSTFAEPDEIAPAYVTGHLGGTPFSEHVHPSTGWAAGGMVSNATDLLRWIDELVLGDVLRPETRARMKAPAELPSGQIAPYGLGLQLLSTGLGPRTRIGHDGSAIVWHATAFLVESTQEIVVGLTNGQADIHSVSDPIWQMLHPQEG